MYQAGGRFTSDNPNVGLASNDPEPVIGDSRPGFLVTRILHQAQPGAGMDVTCDVAMPCSYLSRITEEIISYRLCPGGSAIGEFQNKKAYAISNNMPESTQERPTQKTTAQYLKKDKLQAMLERLFPGQKNFDIRVSRNMHNRFHNTSTPSGARLTGHAAEKRRLVMERPTRCTGGKISSKHLHGLD